MFVDKLAKIKYANLDALIEWQKHHPVEVFFYDSHEDRSIVVELSALVRAVETSPHVGKGVFDDADYLKLNTGVMLLRVHGWTLALLERMLHVGRKATRRHLPYP